MKRHLGYGLWLLMVAILYFFENNTGTRCMLAATAFLPFLPQMRLALFDPDERKVQKREAEQNRSVLSQREEEEPGDIRNYHPGDPVNRIHWKLSAKRQTLLVREATETEWTGQNVKKRMLEEEGVFSGQWKNRFLALSVLMILLMALLLFLIPEARKGALALANALFDASEKANTYVYTRFQVDQNQSVALAGWLIGGGILACTAIACLTGSRLLAFAILIGLLVFQIYFGLSFPLWANIGVLFLFVLSFQKRPWKKKSLGLLAGWVAVITIAVMVLWPGIDDRTEAASEWMRDQMNQITLRITGSEQFLPAGEKEVRHEHPETISAGELESGIKQEYQLVNVEKEQISMPYWINYLKVAFLYLLLAAALIVPFLPFAYLEMRRRKMRQVREVFLSENCSQATYAIFQCVVAWLEAVHLGAGNISYRLWSGELKESEWPTGYAGRFDECAILFEKAVYSDLVLSEDERRKVLSLLDETEKTIKEKADWKQRLRLRYKECLWE